MFREDQVIQTFGALALSEVRALEDAPVRLAPWEAEPYRLWSLWDMVRFYNAAFMAAWGDFNRALALLWCENDIEKFSEAFYGLSQELDRSGLPLSMGTRDSFKLAKMHLEQEPVSAIVVATVARGIVNGVTGDLSQHLFTRVPPSRKSLLMAKEPMFGQGVADAFPDAQRDVEAAGRCLAYDEWTACVFHLMRSLEHPLHALAAKLNVVFPKPIDLENWKNIIDKIDSEITREVKRLEGTTASHERNERLKTFGEIATQMRHFKNAWRNNAAHGREHYDEREADRVFLAVREFMQMMVGVV